MSRRARQRSVTAVYHVIQRGINRMAIFCDDDDRQMFLNLLRLQVCESFKVYCYCLMDNHLHLIVKSDELSFHIHHIASIYAMWFNHKYGRHGYLFKDRFKSEVIEDENYLLRCFRYILYNPVKAGICKKVSAYRWSSYHIYYTIPDPIVTTEFLDLFFDQKEDFEMYMRGEDTGKYMDVEQFCSFTDQEVLQLLNQKLNGRSLPELPVQEKKQLLKEMKQHPSVSQRQLARITGIGFNVIRRL